MAIAQRKRAAKTKYLSQHQLVLEGFDTPFSQKLNASNRWVVLAQQADWSKWDKSEGCGWFYDHQAYV